MVKKTNGRVNINYRGQLPREHDECPLTTEQTCALVNSVSLSEHHRAVIEIHSSRRSSVTIVRLLGPQGCN